ncbi:hypothetical protein BD779DRAFT_1679200 [Infundibulicybe gibba]|nr:hypothetical protein BD779DRAFT_1679200 [Infundibulicybe gibba]
MNRLLYQREWGVYVNNVLDSDFYDGFDQLYTKYLQPIHTSFPLPTSQQPPSIPTTEPVIPHIQEDQSFDEEFHHLLPSLLDEAGNPIEIRRNWPTEYITYSEAVSYFVSEWIAKRQKQLLGTTAPDQKKILRVLEELPKKVQWMLYGGGSLMPLEKPINMLLSHIDPFIYAATQNEQKLNKVTKLIKAKILGFLLSHSLHGLPALNAAESTLKLLEFSHKFVKILDSDKSKDSEEERDTSLDRLANQTFKAIKEIRALHDPANLDNEDDDEDEDDQLAIISRSIVKLDDHPVIKGQDIITAINTTAMMFADWPSKATNNKGQLSHGSNIVHPLIWDMYGALEKLLSSHFTKYTDPSPSSSSTPYTFWSPCEYQPDILDVKIKLGLNTKSSDPYSDVNIGSHQLLINMDKQMKDSLKLILNTLHTPGIGSVKTPDGQIKLVDKVQSGLETLFNALAENHLWHRSIYDRKVIPNHPVGSSLVRQERQRLGYPFLEDGASSDDVRLFYAPAKKAEVVQKQIEQNAIHQAEYLATREKREDRKARGQDLQSKGKKKQAAVESFSNHQQAQRRQNLGTSANPITKISKKKPTPIRKSPPAIHSDQEHSDQEPDPRKSAPATNTNQEGSDQESHSQTSHPATNANEQEPCPHKSAPATNTNQEPSDQQPHPHIQNKPTPNSEKMPTSISRDAAQDDNSTSIPPTDPEPTVAKIGKPPLASAHLCKN